MTVTIENWKGVVGYEGLYEVSDLGRVRTLDATRSNGFSVVGKVLTISPIGGYSALGLRDMSSKVKVCYVHHLVLKAFVGPRPDGHDACHGPRGSSCNELSNLRWDTRKNNLADRQSCGSLNREQVLEIRERLKKHHHGMLIALAGEFNVASATIAGIRDGKTWGWI